MLSYVQAVVVGALQGVTELFPVSSLGHSVLVPALVGGSWKTLVAQQSARESSYLAFLVGLHVATALALVAFFRPEWARVIRGFISSLRERRVADADQRRAWLIVTATIPVGLLGLLFEHTLRTLFAKPLAASVFLTCNGLVLLAGERLRGHDEIHQLQRSDAGAGPAPRSHRRVRRQRERGRAVATLSYAEAGGIGVAQSAALLAGISRSGITMVAGLARGLSHEDAARFAFLLATPVILLAGLYKLPDLAGPNGDGVRGQVVAGSVVAGVAAYVSVRFLTRYFETRTLTPFAVYSLLAGAFCLVRFGLFG